MFKISQYRPSEAIVFAAALAVSTAAAAETVTLLSRDGSINLTGELIAYSEDRYLIDTIHGELNVVPEMVSCFGAVCPIIDTHGAGLVIGGSTTVSQNLMPLLLEEYAAMHGAESSLGPVSGTHAMLAQMVANTDVGGKVETVLISASSSNDGFDKLLKQEIDVNIAARAIDSVETAALLSDGAGDMVDTAQERLIALDALGIVTHPQNPVTVLTTAQVRAIFSGDITNWSSVGGHDQPIAVVAQPLGADAYGVFETHITEGENFTLSAQAVISQTQSEAAQIVSENADAIAFVSLSFQGDTKPVTLTNSCGISLRPDAFSTRTEEYPLHREVYLYTREDNANTQAMSLVNFASSDAAAAIIDQVGFVGLGIDRRSHDVTGRGPQLLADAETSSYRTRLTNDLLGTMDGKDRLSSTLRFREGSSRLDQRAATEQERLIAYLEAQPEGTEITLVGFTDSFGTLSDNLRLSQLRAGQAGERLRSAGEGRIDHISVKTRGFGEIAPAACNTDAEGRRINRRVEVWINSPA